VNGKMIRQ